MRRFILALLLIALCTVCHGGIDDGMYGDWMQQGKEQVKQGKLKDAKESFQNALIFKPNDAEAEKGIRMAEARMGVGTSSAQTKPRTSVKGRAPIHNIRVGIRNSPGINEFEASIGGWSGKATLDAEEDIQFDVMYVRRHMGKDGKSMFGPMWGAGLFMANSTGKEIGGPNEFELSAFGIIGEGGVAAQFGNVMILELMPFLGFGGASQDITGYTTGSGSYVLYGIKGGLFVKLGRNVELGLEAGYSGFSSDGEVDEFGTIYDVTFSGDGFQGGALIVYKF